MDGEVGRVLGRLAPDDLLLVISGYRLESPSPFVRLRDRLADDAGLAVEASRSDGFMLAYGGKVSPGRKTVGAIVDVLPTVLYYLGLPVGRDMDGYARTDLFVATLTDRSVRSVSYGVIESRSRDVGVGESGDGERDSGFGTRVCGSGVGVLQVAARCPSGPLHPCQRQERRARRR